MINFLIKFAEDQSSFLSVHAFLLGFCVYNPRKKDKMGDCLEWVWEHLGRHCQLDGKALAVCTGVLTKAGSAFCSSTQGLKFCNKHNFPSLSTKAPSTTTTTTTELATTDAPFPIGSAVGGFIFGLLLSIVTILLISCLCKRRSSSDDGLSTAESGETRKNKKNKKKNGKKGKTSGTGTGSFETTGSMKTTDASTTQKTKKHRKKKDKKAKKGKKTTGKTSTTQTNTASAY